MNRNGIGYVHEADVTTKLVHRYQLCGLDFIAIKNCSHLLQAVDQIVEDNPGILSVNCATHAADNFIETIVVKNDDVKRVYDDAKGRLLYVPKTNQRMGRCVCVLQPLSKRSKTEIVFASNFEHFKIRRTLASGQTRHARRL